MRLWALQIATFLKPKRRWFQFSPGTLLAASQIATFLKPKRRWFQFSLRTLLAAVAVVAVCLSFWIVPAWRQRVAVEAIEEAGGSASYETPTSSIPVWLRDLAGEDVRMVMIRGRDLTEVPALKYLADLPDLQTISLSRCQFDPKDLAHLKASKSLRELFLYDTSTDDAALVLLGDLRELEMLGLARTGITDKGLAHMSSLPKLHYLSLNGNELSDACVKHLSKMRGLRDLELHGTGVSPEGLQKLRMVLPGCLVNGKRADGTGPSPEPPPPLPPGP